MTRTTDTPRHFLQVLAQRCAQAIDGEAAARRQVVAVFDFITDHPVYWEGTGDDHPWRVAGMAAFLAGSRYPRFRRDEADRALRQLVSLQADLTAAASRVSFWRDRIANAQADGRQPRRQWVINLTTARQTLDNMVR